MYKNRTFNIIPWFYKEWYQYLFAPRRYKDISWFDVILCRMNGHKDATVPWFQYDRNKLEPDMTCNRCGDDLG